MVHTHHSPFTMDDLPTSPLPPSIDRRRSDRRDMRRQERASPWHRQQGTLLAQVMLFGVMVQVVLAVILLHSIPQHEEVLEEANATIGPLIKSASPGPDISVHHPIAGLIRSHPNSNHHDPTQRRNSITFTTMPDEIPTLQISVRAILDFMTEDPLQTFDAVHLCVPDRPIHRPPHHYSSTCRLRSHDAIPGAVGLRTASRIGYCSL
jgi:hypothetical protein